MAILEDLDLLERQLRQLQIEWEKFFAGTERKPPGDMRTRVEALIRQYAYAEIRNNGDRYRYQSLSTRYSTMNELWNKRLRAMEEGRPAAHGPRGLHARPAAPPPPPAAERRAAGAASAPPGEFRISRPQDEPDAVRALFDRYLEARKQTGEGGAVRYENFEKIISQQASRILGEKGGQAVDFRLETKDGKVTLKARPVK
jgi:hypothetical protein